MKRVLFAFVFMCLSASVASASSSCLGENAVAGAPFTASLTDQLISSSGTGTGYSGYIDSCAYIDAGNPFGTSDVTFIYQVIAGSQPSSDIHSVTFGDFGSASLMGAQASCSGCTAATPFFGSNGSGGFFFDFFPVIPVGGQSDYLIVYTDQTSIATGLASLHDTSEVGVAADLATVPEPGSLALVGSGLIGLAGLLRRKLLQA